MRESGAPPGRVAGPLALALVGLTIARLTLTRGQTICALGHALYDDGLFLRLARALLAGDWLGPYDQVTLVKGPFFPGWIAIVHALGLPLLLAEQLLYVSACVALALALKPLLPRTTTLAIYCALLFNPSSYDQAMTTVTRYSVYPALTMLVIACAVGLLGGRDRGITAFAGWAVGLGLTLPAFWLTREEGLWLMPSIVMLLGACALGSWSARPPDYGWRLALCGLPLAIWLLSISAVAAINHSRYGVFATAELKSPDFLAAYGSLARVPDPTADPRVPVPREARKRLYAVSPAFAELKPFLEGDIGRGWTASSCGALSVCSDIGGGWFLWALRHAAAEAGHHRSGGAAASYYRTLASQVDAACASGALRCGPERHTLVPPWRSEYAWPLLSTVLRAAVVMVRFDGFDPLPRPSMGPEDSLAPFRELTGGDLSPRYVIRGWAVSPRGETTLTLRRRDGQRALFHVSRSSSPEVYRRFQSVGMTIPEAAFAGFEITTTCWRHCELQVASAQGLLRRIPLEGHVPSIASPELYLDFESIGYDRPPVASKPDSTMLAVLGALGVVYGALVPWLLLAALALYVAETLRAGRTRALTPHWWIGSALLLAVVVRLLLLSLLHVTSFPTVALAHLAPAHPLLLVFVVMTLAAGRSRATEWTRWLLDRFR